MKLAELFDDPKTDRTITFVDIDETMFKTKAQIAVVKDGQIIKQLSNQQYNTYELQPGEEYDFEQFKDADFFRSTSEPIDAIIDRVAKMIDRGDTIIFLTARADFHDKDAFLQTFRDHGVDVDKAYVERAGNTPGPSAPLKKQIVHKYLKAGMFNHAKMIDDAQSNLDAFMSIKQDFPEIEFEGFLVDEHGGVKHIQ